MENFSGNSNLDSSVTGNGAPASTTGSLIRALTASLDRATLGGLYLSNPVNIRYLTGFTGSYARLFVPTSKDSDPILFTDGRYRDQATTQLREYGAERVRIDPKGSLNELPERLSSLVTTLSQPTLGVEERSITWSELEMVRQAVGAKIEIKSASHSVEELRKRKKPEEIAQLRRAATIGDLALAAVIEQLPQGHSERTIARLLDNTMLDLGADAPSFETIVASGPRAAMPHARPSDRTITRGDLVVIDFGATVNGYHSDCTRTFAIGTPNESHAAVLKAVVEAQRLGVSLLAPTISCATIDRSVREALNENGLGSYFTHGLGHGIGLEIHEAPWLHGRSGDVLEPSMVVTIEPGVYLPGDCGVRIEDSLVVTETGYEVLTKAPKDWIID